MRKDPLVNGQYYHVISRSIAKYTIFNSPEDYGRFMEITDLYRFSDFIYRYSNFLALTQEFQESIIENIREESSLIVEIVAYCIMPTHIHFILKQKVNGGISKYMARILNSYTRYFNTKLKRKGPLYDGKFTSILIKNDEHLLHLTRYIHLNSVSAGLVRIPENWQYSSYKEYIESDVDELKNNLCNYGEIIDLKTEEYKNFVNNRIAYQIELSLIKYLIINDYDG